MRKIRYLAVALVVAGILGMAAGCSDAGDANPVASETTVETKETDVSEEPTEQTTEQAADESAETSAYPVEFTDKFGNQVTIEKTPERVVCYSPELTEILYALDLGDSLIGRSTYCDYPQEAQSVPEMGDMFNLNVETLVDENPDLVLVSSMNDEASIATLIENGITVLALDADTTVEGVYSYIEAVGDVFGVPDQAQALCDEIKEQIQAVENRIAGQDKPTAYFVVSYGEYDSTATGDTFLGDIMELAGSINVAAEGKDWMFTTEQLVEADPDILICGSSGDAKAGIMEAAGYKDLRAVVDGNLYEVDENIFFRQGPRIGQAVEILAEIFHPE